MSYDTNWTKRNHERTEALLKIFADSILYNIEKNNGVFEGSFKQILEHAGLEFDNNNPNSYYGDLFNDINVVLEKYGIQSKKLGRKGRRYWLKDNSKNSDPVLLERDSLIILITNLDIEKISGDECKSILKTLQNLLK